MNARHQTPAPASIVPLLIFLFASVLLPAQKNASYFDGPYIFDQKDSLRLQWIERGVPHDSLIAKKEAGLFKRDSLPVVDLSDLGFKTDDKTSYKEVDKVIAVSDVHGQYDILIRLLQTNGVIDKEMHWAFGKGHLVVNGDNFDRGDRVLDILWFLFFLQKEAEAAGGKVHTLLGNHEIMVLNGDLRYVNKKYYYTSAAFTVPYDQFFRKGSILGDWIASQKVIMSINRKLFVHAGVSPAFLRLGYSMKKVNKAFSTKILRQPAADILNDRDLTMLYKGDGPVWYRGYFDSTRVNLDSVDYILKGLDQETIIIGHTSLDSITTLFGGKIIGIDCSIKLGESGQLLIMEKNKFFIGDMEGNRKALDYVPKPARQSLFDYIYGLDYLPRLDIKTDVGQWLRKSKTEEYFEAGVKLSDHNGAELLSLPARMRARGNTRKLVCRFPPVKLNFEKPLLDSLGFQTLDKLKLVFPCGENKDEQELLYKEFFCYDLFALIDSNGLRAKLVEVALTDEEKKNYQVTGFLIEDEEDYARRKSARILDKAQINASGMDRESFVNMEFFQYMISNTDWFLRTRHNLELVKLPEMERPTAVAYDFDYSGFVGHEYAVPHESLPIKNVHERYFFSYPMSEKEFYRAVAFFLSIEEEVYALCDQATYMNPKTIQENKTYLGEFFKLLKRPKKLWAEMVKE